MDPTYAANNPNFQPQYYRDLDAQPPCGSSLEDGQVVVHHIATARFYYVGWSGALVCVSSAPDSAPFSVDRENDFNVISEFGVASPDQPSVVVSDDKLAFTIDDKMTGNTTTIVLDLAGFLAGANPAAHTPISHANRVRLTPVDVGSDLFWYTLGSAPDAILIGRIRGVPGRTDAVRTRTTTIGFSALTQETAAVFTNGYLYVAAHTGQQWIETALVSGLNFPDSSPFTGTIEGQVRIPSGALTMTGSVPWHPLSVSASPYFHMAVGWTTDDVASHYLLWAFNRPYQTGIVETPVSPRAPVDFVPMGALFQDGNGQYWTCVGWRDGSQFWSFSGGQHLKCWSDSMFPG